MEYAYDFGIEEFFEIKPWSNVGVIRNLIVSIDRLLLRGKLKIAWIWLIHNTSKRCYSRAGLASFRLIVFSDQLSEIFAIFGSDKGLKQSSSGLPGHRYSAIYQLLFKPYKNKHFNFLEIGIGTTRETQISNMGINGCVGASLNAWKKYFTAASIFAFDVDESCLFQSSRITTGLADQTDRAQITKCMEQFENPKFEIVIDDGLHKPDANKRAFEYLRPWFARGTIYVIEDIHTIHLEDMVSWAKSLSLDFCVYASEEWIEENSNLMVIYPEVEL